MRNTLIAVFVFVFALLLVSMPATAAPVCFDPTACTDPDWAFTLYENGMWGGVQRSFTTIEMQWTLGVGDQPVGIVFSNGLAIDGDWSAFTNGPGLWWVETTNPVTSSPSFTIQFPDPGPSGSTSLEYEVLNGTRTVGSGVLGLNSGGGLTFQEAPPPSVPEPATQALFGGGLCALAVIGQRMRKRRG